MMGGSGWRPKSVSRLGMCKGGAVRGNWRELSLMGIIVERLSLSDPRPVASGSSTRSGIERDFAAA